MAQLGSLIVNGVTRLLSKLYVSDSVTAPTFIGALSGNATTATTASAANKLNTNAGSSTQPVYFSNGIPVVATSYANASVASATKATQDSAGQQINTTYIKGLSVSGRTITYTKGNSSTGTITTQDTVYTHPTTSGNKHIPSGGSSGQILRWSADGTAAWGADNNTTYSPMTLGGGYGTCTTAASTTAKVATLSNYALVTGGKPVIRFTYAVPANATLNINSRGAKTIKYNNANITADIIAAGDLVTFIYDGSYYHILAIDKMSKVTQTVQNSSDTVPSGAAVTSKLGSYLSYTVLSVVS